jgi:hypothetical protein
MPKLPAQEDQEMIKKLRDWFSGGSKAQEVVSAGFKAGNGQLMPVPSAEAEPARYEGRPLLILLENYVLDLIGEIPANKQQGLREITQKVFGGGDDWRATMRQTLHLEPAIDENILALWRRNQEIAANAHTNINPIQFAKMIADTNFAPFLERNHQE